MSSIQDITAIIYDRKGKVLSIGKNSYVKTHPVQAKYAEKVGLPEKKFLHAEIAAIIKCRDIARAHKIEVFRVGRDGKYLLAKPCPVCESAITASGIKQVIHT